MLERAQMRQKCSNLAPIGDRVFAIRDDDEDELMGFAVGDRAVVKSLRAMVTHVGNFKGVEPGDVIHLPHQKARITDCCIDGEEYACVKGCDLFAVEKDGAYLPINRYVKVRKCENDHIRDESGAIALYMTENYIEFTNWVEILDVADDCEWIDKRYIGWFFVAPENDDQLQRLGRGSDYCVHESLIKFITDGD